MISRYTPILVMAVAVCLGGCVERYITITSDPPGALVEVSHVEKGRTPITFPFTWYGDWEVVLRLEGHDTLVTNADIQPPWYEVPPLDLFSALAPWTYKDERFVHYTLSERVTPPPGELIQRAEEMEQRNMEPVDR